MNPQREGKPAPSWLVRTRTYAGSVWWRSYKALFDSKKPKYMPHQGAQECARRVKQANK